MDDYNDECEAKEIEVRKKEKLVYNENSDGWTDLAGNCWFGQTFKKGFAGVLGEV